MAGIRVVTDSACDLPQALADQHRIEIVPLTIRFGDDELVDRRDLSPKEFWARSAESPVLPETAAPSAGAFEEVFKRVAGEGADGIVCVTLSSALSATHQAAALAAAKLGEQGTSLDDAAQAVEDLVARSRIFATLDTLENLKKGGRIGKAQALFGSLLSIKPVIELRDGVVEAESKQRTRSKSLRYLVDKVKEHGQVENLVVMHGDAPDLEEFLDLVSAVYPRDDILVGDIGAVIGTHGGPRVMGVVFHVPR